MNGINVCLLSNATISDFNTSIDNCDVVFLSKFDKIDVSVSGNVDLDLLSDLFFDIYSLMYIYIGTFPKLLSFQKNSFSVDIGNFVDRYKTKSVSSNWYFRIVDISAKTINQTAIDNYRKLNQTAIASMQYLDSERYSNTILIEHKFTLLLHVLDGLIDDKLVDTYKQQFRNQYQSIITGRIGDYTSKSYYFCVSYFFPHDKKCGSEILNEFHLNEYEFILMLSDTRNTYSHLLSKKKKHSEDDGKNLIVMFELVLFFLRIHIINEIQLNLLSDEKIKDFLYIIHDWIEDINGTKNFKTGTYKFSEFLKEIKSKEESADN